MKKKILVVLLLLCVLSTSVFALDKTVIAYSGWAGVAAAPEYNTFAAVYAFYGFHFGFIWEQVSLNVGFKGLMTNLSADVGYNLFNTDRVVWSIGGRAALDSYTCPGVGISTNFDGLIGSSSSKVRFDLGFSLAAMYYNDIRHNCLNMCSVEFSPRIGVKF